MGFDREDAYDSCKGYCQNIDFIFYLNEMIFDSDYNDTRKVEWLKIKDYVMRQIESYEERNFGRVLYDPYKLKE